MNLKLKSLLAFTFLFIISICNISNLTAATPTAINLSQTTQNSTKNLSNGVTYTQMTAAAGTKYGGTKGIEFNIVEADLSTSNLYLNSVYGGSNASHAYKKGTAIVSNFDNKNPTLSPIAAINADLWWIYTGSAVEPYNNNKKLFAEGGSFSTSLGFTISQGEIYTSDRMPQESFVTNSAVLGYGDTISFGITNDFVPVISNPNAEVNITNTTQNINAEANGINRLPAYNTLIMYTDKGPKNIYANDDAFEVKIKITSTNDYVIKHGADISGVVEEVYAPGASAPTMAIDSNYIILTARGSKLNSISSYKVGDNVNIKVSVYDQNGKYTKEWQKVTDAISGHIPFATDGAPNSVGLESNYPATLIGIKNSGNVVMITYGSTVNGYRRGIDGSLFDDIAKELDLKDAFVLDGGGSSTMVLEDNNGYYVANHPADSTGERQLLNMLILSVGNDRGSQGDIPNIPSKTANASYIDFSNSANMSYINGAINDTNYNIVGDALKLTSGSGYDPYFTVNYGMSTPILSTSKYKYLTIEYMLPNSNSHKITSGQIFYQVGSNVNANPSYCVNVNNLIRDGKYHKATINFSNVSGWVGNINNLRFDYFNSCVAGDTMYIKSLTLSSSAPATEATPTPSPTPSATVKPTNKPTSTPTSTHKTDPTISNNPTITVSASPTASVTATSALESSSPINPTSQAATISPGISPVATQSHSITPSDDNAVQDNNSIWLVIFIIFDCLVLIAIIIAIIIYKKKK